MPGIGLPEAIVFRPGGGIVVGGSRAAANGGPAATAQVFGPDGTFGETAGSIPVFTGTPPEPWSAPLADLVPLADGSLAAAGSITGPDDKGSFLLARFVPGSGARATTNPSAAGAASSRPRRSPGRRGNRALRDSLCGGAHRCRGGGGRPRRASLRHDPARPLRGGRKARPDIRTGRIRGAGAAASEHLQLQAGGGSCRRRRRPDPYRWGRDQIGLRKGHRRPRKKNDRLPRSLTARAARSIQPRRLPRLDLRARRLRAPRLPPTASSSTAKRKRSSSGPTGSSWSRA